jgi:hypothetical protein
MKKYWKPIVAGVVILLTLGAATWFVVLFNNPQRRALAEGRHAIANHLAEPLDLTAYYDTQASDFENEWAVVPIGFQTFYHVPLQIDGHMFLWGAGFPQNPQQGEPIGPEEILGIPVNRKFETLYVYHTAIFWSPNKAPIYQLVFRYDDGESVTNEIRYGVDILDWYANTNSKGTIIGPTGHNSKLAWHVEYSANGKLMRLRFSLTALTNPNPLSEVTSIDLYSCKTNSAGCIMAMTTGQYGLMK